MVYLTDTIEIQVISGAGNNLAIAIKLVQRMANLYHKQGISGLYGIWLWERAGCQAAWDGIPLEERTEISEQGCFSAHSMSLLSAETWHAAWFWK